MLIAHVCEGRFLRAFFNWCNCESMGFRLIIFPTRRFQIYFRLRPRYIGKRVIWGVLVRPNEEKEKERDYDE